MKEGLDTVPEGVPETETAFVVPEKDASSLAPVPENVGLDTVPVGVPETVMVLAVPEKDPTSLIPVPENEGLDTVPVGVPETETFFAVPENAALRTAPVPVKVGLVAVALAIPVAIVCDANVGRVTAVGVFAEKEPAVHEIVSVSLATEHVKVGSVHEAFVPAETEPPPEADAATNLETVLTFTVIVGVDTSPSDV